MAEEERSFKHLPLSGPGFIRVLYIEPLTEGAEEDSGIVCYIKEVALSDVSEIKYSAPGLSIVRPQSSRTVV